MGDLGLFALGLIVGVLAPVVGVVAGPAVVLALAILSGVRDGKRHLQLSRVGSWAPALLGLMVVPVFLISIFKEQLYGPRVRDGLTLSVVVGFLSAVAVAFVWGDARGLRDRAAQAAPERLPPDELAVGQAEASSA